MSLERLVNAKTFDALSLSFDFYSITDSISFVFVFASEEYEEYVGKGVNDVFGFFISAVGEEQKNLAVIPGTETPISVDNVNAYTNSEWFIPNPMIKNYSGEISHQQTSQLFQYDGFTRELHTGIKIIPNKKYHLHMAIADVGDRFYDSAIILKAGSFRSCGKIEANREKELNFFLRQKFGTSLINDSSRNTLSLPIKFELNSATLLGKETFKRLDQIYEVLASNNNIKLSITGYTDDTGNTDYNLKLSTQRASSVKNYLIGKGIPAEKISSMGKGEIKSGTDASSQERDNHRKVEFFFQVAN